jgi:hypothetical protein
MNDTSSQRQAGVSAFLTEDEVLAAYAEHGHLNWHMVKKGMGPNWPEHWEKLGLGEGIFSPDEARP